MTQQATEADWRARAEKTLGASLDTLISRSADGLAVAPLYVRRGDDDGTRPWRKRAAWAVAQRVDHPDSASANDLALLELEGGANALTLVYAGSPFARGFGLAPDTDLDLVLEKVELDFIGLRVDAGTDTHAAAQALADLVERRALSSAALAVDLGHDPIGLAARHGGTPDDSALTAVLDLAAKAGLSGRPLLADARPYHEAGAGEAWELAALLATGVAYLRQLEAAGLELAAARDALAFLLVADADVFLGLAKFRALRRLWARVEAASGLEPKPMRLHAETAWRVMTRRDPWTNVMRATAGTFAAGLGGADAITVLPYTLVRGLPGEPARRLARHVQRVLLDEANLAMVDDPAAGAGGFEALTDALCEKSWALFQGIERDGGIARVLEDGGLAQAIAEQAIARGIDVADVARGIVGTSLYATLDAPEIAVIDVKPRKEAPRTQGLACVRDAEPFETLRDRAERDISNGRFRVFLATLGAPAAFGPRATYAINFFASAGILAEAPAETRDADALVAAFSEAGTPAACLCGADKAYGDVAALAERLRAAGARRIVLVGDPGEKRDAWRKAGIDRFIHVGCEALTILGETVEVISESRKGSG